MMKNYASLPFSYAIRVKDCNPLANGVSLQLIP